MERFVSLFRPKTFLSWPVFGVTLIWALMTNLLDSINNPRGFYFERFLSVFTAHIVLFIGIFLWVFAVKRRSALFQAISIVPVVVFLSMLRGLVVWLMMSYFGLGGIELLSFRVFGAIAIIGIPLLLTAAALNKFQSYSQTKARLENENQRLLELRSLERDRIRQETENRLEQIRTIVLESLKLSSKSSSEETINAINHTLETVVRPMSHELDEGVLVRPEEETGLDPGKINWKAAFLGAISPDYLHPLAVALSFFATALLFMATNYPPIQALFLLLLIASSTFVGLSLLKYLLKRIELKVSSWLRVVAFLAGVVMVGLIVGISLATATLGTTDTGFALRQPPYFITGLTLLFALGSSAQEQADAANRRLAEIGSQLTWEMARVSEEQRQLRKSLANLLHGKLQSALTSSLLRLRIAAKSEHQSIEMTNQAIVEELQNLIKNSQLTDFESVLDLNSSIEAVRQTWQDIAEISLEVDPKEAQKLETDVLFLRTLSDLVYELAFNSIKHGESKQVAFRLKIHSNKTVVLECQDDGKSADMEIKVGMGTKLFDECSIEWHREQTDKGTKTWLVIPIELKS